MRKLLLVSLALLLVACGSLSAQAAGWGNVTGKFTFDGTAPKPAALKIDKDPATCGKHGLVDESLVIGKDGGIANIVVGLFLKAGAKKPEIHPDLVKPTGEVVFDNSKCRFEPHVAVVRTGQTLVLANKDDIGHNVKADLLSNSPFNDLLPAGASLKKILKAEERLPITCSCSIHPWMKGYLIVRDDPYVAVSSETGEFKIANLPAGKWTLRVWQEKSGYIEDVKLGAKATKWAKGQVEVTIEDGKTFDFGEIKVGPKEFVEK
ncbi:MAG TPA: carboxypeptidase regulatory-like domain-containing protein [Pirellulaceae bacterium]|nr:carboxypeptidase regulatory-like domain-containing protein [Pirellulaceae bacterium]